MPFANIQHIKTMWHPLSHILSVPRTEEEYDRIVQLLDTLIDEVGEDESHPLASFMEVLGVLVETYEDNNIPEITEL